MALKRKKERENIDSAKPTGLTSLKAKPQSCIQEENPILTRTCKESVSEDSIMEIYEPFLSDGFVSLNSDSAQSTPIKILRDTGASQSLILADTLPFSEKSSSGTSVLIQGVECGFVNVPLHNIYLSSDLVKGPVAVGIRPSLPFKDVVWDIFVFALENTPGFHLIRAKVCSVFKLKFALNIPYYVYLFLETRHTISRCHIATHFDLKACPSTCLNLFVVTKCLKHTLGYHDTDITIYMHQQTQKANMAKEVFV